MVFTNEYMYLEGRNVQGQSKHLAHIIAGACTDREHAHSDKSILISSIIITILHNVTYFYNNMVAVTLYCFANEKCLGGRRVLT